MVSSSDRAATSGAILRYLFDPFCGWCYAAAPQLAVAEQLAQKRPEAMRIALHAGGMMMGRQRQPVTPQLREYVLPHDARIASLTGQPFSAAYRDGLLRDTNAVFDSEPPITAILAVEQLSGLGLAMLKRLQQAHYVEGRRIADVDVLTACAEELGVMASAFAAGFAQLQGTPTVEHVEQSRRLLEQVGGRGFPTLVLEKNGERIVLPWSQYIGKLEEWRRFLRGQLDGSNASIDADTIRCSIEDGRC